MRFTTLPFAQGVAKRIFRRELADIERSASKSWIIHPEESTVSPPAIFLPGQLERIEAWPYQDVDPAMSMAGGLTIKHLATKCWQIDDALLIQGRLAKNWSVRQFHGARHTMPLMRIADEIDVGAVYCSTVGTIYFAHWLMDDCLTYLLAEQYGPPIATAKGVWAHTQGYENLLGMHSQRYEAVLIKKAFVFEDIGQNTGKRLRAERVRQKLLQRWNGVRHPGVFILRGASGQRRVLRNEMELAQRLQATRGFRIVAPESMSVLEIVDACAGADIVMGVEGSQLIHGMAELQKGHGVLTLQPPRRFIDSYKHLTDRDDQHFGFVVGKAVEDDFVIDADEVERTLDLFPRPENVDG